MTKDINGSKRFMTLQEVERSGGQVLPQWRIEQSRGYTHFPQFDSEIAEQMTADLDSLVDTDYLDKAFFDRLTICPSCGSHHVNVREACSSCKSAHITPLSLLHHFRCGYVAPIDEFPKEGKGRTCPKCHGHLEDLGTDHDMAGENFVCHSCHASFQVPETEGLCMACQTRTPGEQLLHQDIFSYRLNSLGMAALKNGRLFERDEEQLLEGDGKPIYRRHVFMFLLEDEKRRAKRYGTPFGLILLRLDASSDEEMEKLVFHMAENLRASDKIGRYNTDHLMVLLPETDGTASGKWLKRFMASCNRVMTGNSPQTKLVELNMEADLAGQLTTSVEQSWTR